MSSEATSPPLEKAVVKVVEGSPPELGGQDRIPVSFYPTEYSLDKSVTYGEQNLPGTDTPVTQFGSGNAETLTMEFLFDTYEDEADVRERYTDKIDALLTVDGDLHAPPIVQILWGKLTEFRWVVQSARRQFTMFLSDGTPVRARVNVTFKEYRPPGRQTRERPRSSADKTKLRTVREGDSLWLLASREYGDPTAWRPIADENGITNPRTLQPGTELVIPPLGDG